MRLVPTPAGLRAGPSLRLLAIWGYLATLCAALLVPVYSDEIGWRFQERAGIDGVDKMYNDLCGPNTLARPPWFMMPVRWFSAFTNQAFADPLFIRIEGLLCACAWALVLWRLTSRLEIDRAKRDQVQALAFALLGLGTLPFLMVMSRPEQPLILTLTLMVSIVFARTSVLGARAVSWLKAAAIVGLGAIAASYHLKGVAYAPVALACLAVCAKGRDTLAPRLLGAAALVGLMVSAAQYWAWRFQCLGDAALAAKLAGENIASILASRGQTGDVLLQAVDGANPLNYVWLAAPDNEPMSYWLPGGLFPAAVIYAIVSALALLWTAGFVLAVARLVTAFVQRGLRALAEPRVVVALAILACVLVWGASQVNRNVYEAAHVLPMLALFLVLCLSLPDTNGPWRVLSRLVPVAVPVAVLSEVALVGFTAGPLLAAARTPGYLADQPASVSLADYASIRRDIAGAMKQAGIPAGQHLRGLLVDDVTYLALQRHVLPFHRYGVLEAWNGSIEDPAKYLASRNSDGVVMACSNLPMSMEMASSRSGQVCALSRATVQDLTAPPPPIWNDDP